MCVEACNSYQSRSQEQWDGQDSESISSSTDIGKCYEEITRLCDKMSKEGNAFWNSSSFKNYYVDLNGNHCHITQVCPSAGYALTTPYHDANQISLNIKKIKQGNDLISNLQEIENQCYMCEKNCRDGINELKAENRYVPSDMKNAWLSVLERINDYSSRIREQVQFIRESQ